MTQEVVDKAIFIPFFVSYFTTEIVHGTIQFCKLICKYYLYLTGRRYVV